MKKYITIIPARGGSKRFPGKNIHDFMGKPLIAHSIDSSNVCAAINHTYVSTDDNHIKQVSLQFGAEIINRPAELGSDFATSADVMKNAVEQLIAKGVEFDYVLLLQATNPLRPANLLNDAIKIVEETKVDSLMTVNRSELKLGKIIDNHFQPWNYHYGQRSQDLDPLYYENGLLYISSKELLLQGKITSENMYPMVVDHIFGKVDIDTREDMEYAEFIAKRYGK
jgi:N-acylneuraminate cytidylyltransferase